MKRAFTSSGALLLACWCGLCVPFPGRSKQDCWTSSLLDRSYIPSLPFACMGWAGEACSFCLAMAAEEMLAGILPRR